MNEYRRSPRKAPFVNTTVTDLMTGEVMGRIGNLSSDGMLMVCDAEVVDDALFQLAFDLFEADGSSQSIKVGVQEMWCEAANVPGQFWAGFHFIDISDDNLNAVESWLGELEE